MYLCTLLDSNFCQFFYWIIPLNSTVLAKILFDTAKTEPGLIKTIALPLSKITIALTKIITWCHSGFTNQQCA